MGPRPHNPVVDLDVYLHQSGNACVAPTEILQPAVRVPPNAPLGVVQRQIDGHDVAIWPVSW